MIDKIENQVEEAGKEVLNVLEGVGNSIWNVLGGGEDEKPQEEDVEGDSPRREEKA